MGSEMCIRDRFSTVTVGGSSVKFKLDTGAEANVLPLSVNSELQNKSPLMGTSVALSSYGDFKEYKKTQLTRFAVTDGVEVIFDDIIVAATDEKEHDETMLKLLERARQANVKFNSAKLQYKVSEVKYMGNIVSESGLKPDVEKVRTITQLPLPS